MSLKTWKEEFYPVPAKKVTRPLALNHSLQKWLGLREANLAKHGVRLNNAGTWPSVSNIGSLGGLSIYSGSCALCKFYMDSDFCSGCPLFEEHDSTRCDYATEEEDQSPWEIFIRELNPEPMIELLQTAIRNQ